MAMGITEGNVMKKGGSVKKYASGGLAIFGPSISKKDKEILESPLKKENSSVQKTKSGGRVAKYANGGAVSNAAAANLPAMGDKKNVGVDFNAGKAKIASLKKGGSAKKPGLMIAIAVGRKGSARGR
jgi:hypothetical protein